MKTFKAICIKPWGYGSNRGLIQLFVIYEFKEEMESDGDYEFVYHDGQRLPCWAETKTITGLCPVFDEHFIRIPTRAAIQPMEQDHDPGWSGGGGVHLRASTPVCGAGGGREGDLHQHGDVPGGDACARGARKDDADDLVTDQVGAGGVPEKNKNDLRKRSPRRRKAHRAGVSRKGETKCR